MIIRGLWPILLVVVLSGESIGMRFVDMLVILMFAFGQRGTPCSLGDLIPYSCGAP